MYKTASANRQHAVDQIGQWQPWASGDMPMTPADEAAAARAALKQIEQRILALPDGEERTALGRQKHGLQNRIAELRKAGVLAKKADLSDYIIEVMKARMTKGEWVAVVAAARRLYDQGAALKGAD